jgi:DNA-binding response OmpR family regulator
LDRSANWTFPAPARCSILTFEFAGVNAVIRVIVVEDESDLRDSISIFLTKAGMDVRGVGDGPGLDAALADRPADILVLDVNLPGENGFSLALRHRAQRNIGVIMLTARSQTDDQIVGLASGADSYLLKPLDLRVLEATIRNLAHRLAGVEPGTTERQRSLDWEFDPATWMLTAPNGISVELSASEQKVLSVLASTDGEPASREAILSALGKSGFESDDHSLNAMLTRLRRKVETATGMDLPIRAIRTVGYAFAARLVSVGA